MDLELLKNNAKAFKKAADRCCEQRTFPNNQIEFLAVPAIVNLAFSLELYLKYILSVSKKGCRGHKLQELFNSLDKGFRQEIISSTKYNNAEFEDLLNKHNEAFTEWRYLHEKNKTMNVDIEFMRIILGSEENIVRRF